MGKARIVPFRSGSREVDLGKAIDVDFNPQSLRLSYRTTGGGGTQNAKDQSATQGARNQPTGYTAQLTVELTFDTTRDGSNVRLKTDRIAALIQAIDDKSTPSVSFRWGDFAFDGTLQSMDETLDYFSDTGVPLRATVSLSMAGFKPEAKAGGGGAAAGGGAGFAAGASAGVGLSAGIGLSAGASVGVGFSASASVAAGVSVGTTPLTLAQSGDTLQSLAAQAGADWKAVAAANNVDNPRLVEPGTVLDLKAGVRVG